MRKPFSRLPHVLELAFLASLLCSAIRVVPQETSGHVLLRKVTDIPLPGPAVRFDYQSLDPSQGRLYITHMNANHLVVFDVRKREVIANLDGFPSVHGVWAVPELSRIYASATGEHKVAIVDAKALKTIAKVGTINYPDGLAYAAGPKRVFVSSLTII
jgi:DNA-binding beta-propeller fold protein YncE